MNQCRVSDWEATHKSLGKVKAASTVTSATNKLETKKTKGTLARVFAPSRGGKTKANFPIKGLTGGKTCRSIQDSGREGTVQTTIDGTQGICQR